MAEDPRLADNRGRVEHEAEIDNALSSWCAARISMDILNELEKARVPSGPIYNVEDMINDEHFQQRDLFEEVIVDGEALKIPAILPKLTGTPGATLWPGEELGQHNREVLQDLLGLDDAGLLALHDSGVVRLAC